MADTKISALTVATTPLAGTEVLPIVQSGVTKQVSVADLTAGRAVSAASLTLTTTPLAATSGGTGQSSYAIGDLLYASTTTVLSKLADVATGNALISGGVGVAPSWGKIGLTTHVSGTLPVGNGGTGTATAFTAGSVIFAGASGVYSQDNSYFFYDLANTRLGLGTNTPARRLEIAGLTGGPALRITNSNSNSGIEILPTSAKLSWLLGVQYNIDQTFEITPSTVNGGTTFTTPVFTANGSTGDLGFRVGNLVQGTAAKGINFTANTGAAGKTSQLLNWYEEGTWTPSFGGSTTYYGRAGTYTRVGRLVFVEGYIHIDTNGTGSQTTISGLPFTPASSRDGIVFAYNTGLATNIVSLSGRVETGGTIVMYSRTAAATASAANNLCANAAYFEFSGCYYV